MPLTPKKVTFWGNLGLDLHIEFWGYTIQLITWLLRFFWFFSCVNFSVFFKEFAHIISHIKFIGIKLFVIFSFYSFNIYRLSFIYDINNLYLVFLPLLNRSVRHVAILLIFVFFNLPLALLILSIVYVFCFIDLYFYL